jgi:hypothetical protein
MRPFRPEESGCRLVGSLETISIGRITTGAIAMRASKCLDSQGARYAGLRQFRLIEKVQGKGHSR